LINFATENIKEINFKFENERKKERKKKKMRMASSISPHSHPILTLQYKADIDRVKRDCKDTTLGLINISREFPKENEHSCALYAMENKKEINSKLKKERKKENGNGLLHIPS